jgi:hypothetical protein
MEEKVTNIQKMEQVLCGEIQQRVDRVELIKGLVEECKKSKEPCNGCGEKDVSWHVKDKKYVSFCTNCESMVVEDE